MLNNNSDMNNNINKETKIPSPSIWAGIGALMLSIISAVLFFMLNTFVIPEGYAETTGVILDDCPKPYKFPDDIEQFPTSCFQYIEFEVNGEIYKITTSVGGQRTYGHNHTRVGLEVKIIYNIKDPNDAQEKHTTKSANIVFICLMIGGVVISIAIFVQNNKEAKKSKVQNENDLQYK